MRNYICLADGQIVQPSEHALILMCEHLIWDNSFMHVENELTHHQISLQNLGKVVKSPEQSVKSNLTFGNDMQEILFELDNLWTFVRNEKVFDWVQEIFLIENTSKKCGQDIEKLIELQMRCPPQFKICISQSPSAKLQAVI